MPDEKKINPKMANGQGLRLTKFFPKIPMTPMISPAIPKTTSVIANDFAMSGIICDRRSA
jgi:hypothetical protein